MWHSNKLVRYTYTATASKIGYAIIEDVSGWRQIYPATTDGVSNLFGLLCVAKASNRRVNVYIRNINNTDYITHAYLV
jgi:hypothetical protein